jgi:hypothetical protein
MPLTPKALVKLYLVAAFAKQGVTYEYEYVHLSNYFEDTGVIPSINQTKQRH